MPEETSPNPSSNTSYDDRQVPFMTDKLPEYFVDRPTEFENIVNALVNADGAVAITAMVRGAGGFGKHWRWHCVMMCESEVPLMMVFSG